MKIYLAGCYSRPYVFEEYADLLSRGKRQAENPLSIEGGADAVERYINNESISCRNRGVDIPRFVYRGGGIPNWKPYILESFYYANKDEIQKLMPYFGDFLLDSGAFTFMQNSKTHVDWNEYLEGYADFINKYNIDKFFELDIDSVVGYDNVLKMRKKLESLTNKQCIPVWHLSRGKEEYLKMCDEYPYVSIGGLVGKAARSRKQKMLENSFPWFISEAHKRNAKVHGLGYTSEQGIRRYHFDSVDSTAWTTGNRFGHVYKFDGKRIVKTNKPDGTRMPKEKARELAVNNFVEWCKFQEWAETHIKIVVCNNPLIKNYGGMKNEYRITCYRDRVDVRSCCCSSQMVSS